MPFSEFNGPHDLCMKKYPIKRNFKKQNNETGGGGDFGGSTSSLEDAERQTPEPTGPAVSTGDRLVQLIVKGVLYENCVNYAEQVATSNTYSAAFGGKEPAEDDDEEKPTGGREKPAGVSRRSLDFSNILSAADSGKADLKLLNWLTSLPKESFNYYFDNECPLLLLNTERCEKPVLTGNWSETILSTPIKPKVFPSFGAPQFHKMPNGLTGSTAPTNGILHPASGQQLAVAGNPTGQQLASLISNLSTDSPAAAADQLAGVFSLIGQMNGGGGGGGQSFSTQQVPNAKGANTTTTTTTNYNDLKQLYQALLMDDLTKPVRERAETNENGLPKLDYLAQNFSELTSLNDLSGSNLFGLANGNGLNGNAMNGSHTLNSNRLNGVASHGSSENLVAGLSKSQLSSLLQSAQLGGLIGQSLNAEESAPMLNAKLAGKVPKDLWPKKQNVKKNHLYVVNNLNDSNKLNHSFVTNQSLYLDDDLCGKGGTGKRAKQYKKRDSAVSIYLNGSSSKYYL